MIRNPLIAQRLFNTPLLVHPAKLDAIIAGLSDRIGIGAYAAPAPNAFTSQSGQWSENGLYRMVGDVGVFDIFGILAHRGGIDANCNYILGYQTIARQLSAAIDDSQAGGIVLNFDSPGGEVAGAFDLASLIFEARGKKPIRAVASDLAASAAYLNATAADSLAVTQNAYTGSIGVVMRHVDFSQALAADGIKVTHIFAGDRKIDGNQFEPLPDAVRAQFQDEINSLYEAFVGAVATYRGMKPADIRATQAAVYRGQAAVDAGLADSIATPDQVIAQLQSDISARAARVSLPARGKTMSTQTPPADATYTQAEFDKAKAEAHAAGLSQGRTEGASDERTRVLGILNHAEASGRAAQAVALIDTDLTVEAAGKVLAASPKVASAASAATPFERHMAALGNPPVGTESEDAASESEMLIAQGIALLPANRRPARA